MGPIEAIEEIFHANIVDEVAVCLPRELAGYLEPVASLAADEGKTVRIPVDLHEGALLNAREEEFEGLLVRSLVHDGQREVGLVIKRLIDIVGATVGLVVLSPLLLGHRDRDPAPRRLAGPLPADARRPPRTAVPIVKFRTMAPDAEERLHEVAHLNERSGAAFKATNDPRLSRARPDAAQDEHR